VAVVHADRFPIVARGVADGRRAVNFSEWGTYLSDQQRALLAVSSQDPQEGRMPGSSYTRLRPETRLSAQDIMTICAAAIRAGGRLVGAERR
jgi:hypothetical protein